MGILCKFCGSYGVLWALWEDYVYFTEKLCMCYVILWAFMSLCILYGSRTKDMIIMYFYGLYG